MENQIIIIEQLPVISEKLAEIKEAVKNKVAVATALVCTEDTVKEVKKARAELNSEFKAWESKRLEVKKAIMTPYEQFEAVYKDCISDTYKVADKDLKIKIDSVESELKTKKATEVKEYFTEYLASKEIDFVTYEQANVNVTMSASLKSLKEQAKTFIDRIADDLALIKTQEHKAEILVEYKRTLNVSNAITSATARLRAIEEEKKRQEEAAIRKAEEEKRIAEIKAMQATQKATAPVATPITAPVEEKKAEPEKPAKSMDDVLTLSFKVTDSRRKLIELKKFLDNGGYHYE